MGFFPSPRLHFIYVGVKDGCDTSWMTYMDCPPRLQKADFQILCQCTNCLQRTSRAEQQREEIAGQSEEDQALP
jgi:hypothetical protein